MKCCDFVLHCEPLSLYNLIFDIDVTFSLKEGWFERLHVHNTETLLEYREFEKVDAMYFFGACLLKKQFVCN